MLIHSYTLADLHHAARVAAGSSAGYWARDYHDRYETALSAVLELANQPNQPNQADLVRAGQAALVREISEPVRRDRALGPNGRVYWLDWLRPHHAGNPAGAVIEQVAAWQILARLTSSERDALLALAAADDYRLAAELLGVSYSAFTLRVRNARCRFLRLWHEGEMPSRPWGKDQRTRSGSPRNAIERRRRSVARSRAGAA